MAKKKSQPRPNHPSYRNNFLVRECRGVVVASAWPRSRPSPRHPLSEWWSEWFRQATLLWRAMPGEFANEIRTASRGQPQMARDIALASMRGTLWSYTNDEGFLRYPMQAYSKISESLNVITRVPGALLVRGPELWTFVEPGISDGLVLTWNDTAQLPQWATPTGAGAYAPPLVADFPTIVGSPAATTAQASTGPLVLRRAVADVTSRIAGALRPLAAPPRTYTFALRISAQLVTNRRFGIIVRDSATDRCVCAVYLHLLPTSVPRLQWEQWTNTALFHTAVFFRDYTPTTPVFLRLHDDGTNFRIDYSADAGNWATLTTVARNAWCAHPNQIGFGLGSAAVETIESTVAALHYHEV